MTEGDVDTSELATLNSWLTRLDSKLEGNEKGLNILNGRMSKLFKEDLDSDVQINTKS